MGCWCFLVLVLHALFCVSDSWGGRLENAVVDCIAIWRRMNIRGGMDGTSRGLISYSKEPISPRFLKRKVGVRG